LRTIADLDLKELQDARESTDNLVLYYALDLAITHNIGGDELLVAQSERHLMKHLKKKMEKG
jgi:hypothetical protein